MRFRNTLLLFTVTGVSACLLCCNNKKNNAVTVPANNNKTNIVYIFPQGLSEQHKDSLSAKCREAIHIGLRLIKDSVFDEQITVHFLNNRAEIKELTGMGVSGMAYPERKTLYSLSGLKEAPITHEMMHMIVLLKWGVPPDDCIWMNEGIATLADNNCNGYTVREIYRYLMASKMLLPIERLSSDFYKQPEMIAYHQTAYWVQYLLEQYGVEKFKTLWQKGMKEFEHIYGRSFQQEKDSADARAIQLTTDTPPINWKEFEKGCF